MTLVEVLVALAVFAMLSAILLGYGAYVDNTSKATRTLKDKVVEETHYASSKNVKYKKADGSGDECLDSQKAEIVITMSDRSGSFYEYIDPDHPENGLRDTPTSYNDPSETFEVTIYDTEKVYDESLRSEGYSDTEVTAKKSQANGRSDISFIYDSRVDNIDPDGNSLDDKMKIVAWSN